MHYVVKDCLTLFGKLNETLTASWDYMYEEAKKYYEQNGSQIKRLESIGMTWENTDAADVFNVSGGKLIQNDELRGRAV